MKRPGWFGPKRLGFGIGPKSWEGWGVLVAYILFAKIVPRNHVFSTGEFWSFQIVLFCLLMMVIYLTYEKDEEEEE